MSSNDYKSEYATFMQLIDSGTPVEAETVGRLIVKFAGYFSEAVAVSARLEHGFNKTLAQTEETTDPSGKPISSTKAEHIARATDSYRDYLLAKSDVLAIEQCINALKSLQKSLQNDFSYSGV